jgi:hypothetical protein
MRIHRPLLVLLTAALTTTAACSKKEEPPPTPAPAPVATPAAQQPAAAAPFALMAVTLGKQIGADKQVVEEVTVFAPTDTIYASVNTSGAAPSVALKARWTYEDGQLVNESQEVIAPTGPAITEFHIAKPSGWPTGKYQVEISGPNGTLTKTFQVQ